MQSLIYIMSFFCGTVGLMIAFWYVVRSGKIVKGAFIGWDTVKARYSMINVRNKEAIKEIAVGMGLLVCLFFIGCKDKSAATDHYERGEAHYLDGEYDQAFSELTKAIEINPKLARAYVIRGMADNDKGKFDLAVADYSKVIEIKPTDAHAYVGRGMAYLNNGEYDPAVADYNKAIEIDPTTADAYRLRARAYTYKGEYDKAWKDVYEAQALGRPFDSKFLEKLREASGRDK